MTYSNTMNPYGLEQYAEPERQPPTPGPWDARQATEPPFTWGVWADVGDPMPFYVAEVCTEADARLMAAAPDLLVACRAVQAITAHSRACDECGAEEPCDEWFELDQKAQDLMKAALTGLEGV